MASVRRIRKQRGSKIVAIMDSEYSFELSGNGGGFIPGFSPAVPPFPLPAVVGVVGTFGLFEVCVVGVVVPPAVLKFASFKQSVLIEMNMNKNSIFKGLIISIFFFLFLL
jgi:hypothetical protein